VSQDRLWWNTPAIEPFELLLFRGLEPQQVTVKSRNERNLQNEAQPTTIMYAFPENEARF
jgi:hypothetical protein